MRSEDSKTPDRDVTMVVDQAVGACSLGRTSLAGRPLAAIGVGTLTLATSSYHHSTDLSRGAKAAEVEVEVEVGVGVAGGIAGSRALRELAVVVQVPVRQSQVVAVAAAVFSGPTDSDSAGYYCVPVRQTVGTAQLAAGKTRSAP